MFKKMNEEAVLPISQTEFSAGYDLCTLEETVIEPKSVCFVPTGICLDQERIRSSIEDLHSVYLSLHSRSSLSKKGLLLANGVGVIDIDYSGELCVPLYNFTKEKVVFPKHERIAQLIFQTHLGFALLGNDFRKDDKRSGGFGSTGTN